MNQPPYQMPQYPPYYPQFQPPPKKSYTAWWIVLGIGIGIFSCIGCTLFLALSTSHSPTYATTTSYSDSNTSSDSSSTDITFSTPTPSDSAPGNPWGYNFEPESGHYIYDAPANFCRYFKCLQPFGTANDGFVVECNDGKYSHSGGNEDACLYDGGVKQALYWH